MGLKSLLENPQGGQLLSAMVGLTLLIGAGSFFSISMLSRFFAGAENWWMGLVPSFGSFALALRLNRYMRSRHAR